MQLFLLHFAGGSCYSYEFLRKSIPDNFDFLQLELPGRGKRYKDAFLMNRSDAVKDYVSQIKEKRTSASYVLYGHSMGAYLAYFVAKEMERIGDPPVKLVLSGNSGPNVIEYDEEGNIVKKPKRYLMNDEEFKEELKELGGVNEEIFTNKELFDFFTPILRADFEVVEKDESNLEAQNERVNIPIHVLMGDEEEYVDYIDNWKRYTFSYFESQILKGNHFFIYEYPEKIAEVIKSAKVYY
ncbi:Surfactin synthase thioesterase subunit [Kordia antarctica]|uniref:Surfactin synthase thioesterase subunit n=1 Tax=Kordia antarctica TaxID=1218801 RepID=A0A7L4ZG68_9FLAO|nr:alpha/beta fold hydrolase [Kordia antarctica]QHI35437.1 Surfactin synthase thioesterase subunit [Kordia antarctica]